MELLLGAIACGLFLIYLKLDDIVDQLKNKDMKDCTTCKYGFVDEQLGFPMCHHPSRFSEDCVDFNMHEEIEEPEKATGIEEKKLPDGLEEAADNHIRRVVDAAGHPGWDWETRDVRNAFIAGAEWMEEHARKEDKI